MLQLTNVTKSFGGNVAVDRVSCSILQGKITALIGPNGAGKTSLFNLISGTLSIDQGQILFGQTEMTRLSVERRARLGISRTFQLTRPFRNLTVRDHLALAHDQMDDRFWFAFLQSGTNQDKVFREAADHVGLTASLDQCAADLSYGQGKLLAIAMALIHPHQLLLLDEPVAGVNPVLREQIATLLQSLKQAHETMLIIEHDMSFVLPLADQVIVMDRGRILAQGTAGEIKQDPAVLHAYLGQQL